MAATACRMQEDAPPSRTDNLPVQLTRFIGREREIGEVRRLVLAQRLVTLTGMGGIGKTRLALAVAETLLGTFADGVWHVDLAVLVNPALAASAVATVLGVREEGERPLPTRLAKSLRARRLLLLLDNCEHLATAVRPLAEMLLSAAPDVRILATSRVALGATGEVLWRVPPLSTPDMSQWPLLNWKMQMVALTWPPCSDDTPACRSLRIAPRLCCPPSRSQTKTRGP